MTWGTVPAPHPCPTLHSKPTGVVAGSSRSHLLTLWGCTSSRGHRGGSFPPLTAPGGCRSPWACGHIARLCPLPWPSLCLGLPLFPPTKTFTPTFYLETFTPIISAKTLFPDEPYSRVLEVSTWTHFGGTQFSLLHPFVPLLPRLKSGHHQSAWLAGWLGGRGEAVSVVNPSLAPGAPRSHLAPRGRTWFPVVRQLSHPHGE